MKEYRIFRDISWIDAVQVYLLDKDEKKYYTLKNGKLIANEWNRRTVNGAKLLFTIENASQFMEALIQADVKPPEGKYLKGKLEATEKHLEDMRELVFKKGKK